MSIIFPAQINSSALNRAWVIRWKNAISGSPSPRVNIIIATCLKVERAMIFFMSHSAMALALAISMVIVATTKRAVLNWAHLSITGKNRNSKYTPAVTSVEEWTRALTGVGAAIAAGSHLEKGIWALFVIAATIIMIAARQVCLLVIHWDMVSQFLSLNIRAIVINNITSPIRLVMAVIMPAPNLLGLL